MRFFNYGIGASWVFRFEHRPIADGRRLYRQYRYVRYTVEGCELRGSQVEYYTIRCVEEGKPDLYIEQTASRLRYLINFNLAEVLSNGTSQRYPLLPCEVAEWYRERKAQRVREYKLAQHILSTHKRYNHILQKQKRAKIEAAKAEAVCEFDKATLLNAQIRTYTRELAAIRAELGITDEVLELKYECPVCKDTGLTEDGRVCLCAKQHESEIRAYVEHELGEVGA